MQKSVKSCLASVLIPVIVIIAGVAVMFFADLCPPQGPWPIPPWCEGEVTLPTFLSDLTIPNHSPDPYVYYGPGEIQSVFEQPVFLISPWFGRPETIIPSTGVSWSPLQIDDWSPQAVRSLHDQGLPFLGAAVTPRHLNISEADPKLEIAALDIDLQPILLTKPGMTGYLEGEYFYSISNPEWQELMVEQGRRLIDFGVQGIMMDEPDTYGKLVFSNGGSFDEYSLKGFREFLAEKYDSQKLDEYFGITDIDNFDFRAYLLERNMQDLWNASDQNPTLITYEFFLFQNKAADDFIRRYAEEMRTYARDTYDRDFVFSYSSSPLYDSAYFLSNDYLDFLTGELFYFGDGYARAAIHRKLADGVFPKPITLLAEVAHDTGMLPPETKNLFKYMFADIYSNPNTSMIFVTSGPYTMQNGNYVEPFVKVDLAEVNRYVSFMNQHTDLFNLEEPTKVGLVYSTSSYASNRLPTEEQLWGNQELLSVMEILLNERIPFGMLVSGNGFYSVKVLTLDDLRQYKVVILPNVQLVSDGEIQALLDYVQEGGVVIQVNSFGEFDEKGVRTLRNELSGLTPIGSHHLGMGNWESLDLWESLSSYYWNAEENRAMQVTELSFDHPAAVALRAAITKYHPTEITSDAPITVGIRRFSDDTRLVIHLINYNYDQTIDTFTPSGPFTLTVNTEGLNLSSAKIYDFESGSVNEIQILVQEDRVTLSIPDLQTYTILELKP